MNHDTNPPSRGFAEGESDDTYQQGPPSYQTLGEIHNASILYAKPHETHRDLDRWIKSAASARAARTRAGRVKAKGFQNIDGTWTAPPSKVEEGVFGDALKQAFQAPPEHGGLPAKPKSAKRPLRREPLIGRVKRTAIRVGDAVFPRIDKPEESITFYGRIFTEAKREPWHETLKRGVEGLKNISRATAGEGPTPKFSDNPWAHIVHRAALHVDKRKEQPQSDSPERKAKPSDLFGGSKTTGHDSSTMSAARRAFLQVQQDREMSLADRQQRLNRRARANRANPRLGGSQPGGSSRPGQPSRPPR